MSARRSIADDLRAALPGWIAGRVLVLIGWGAAVVYTNVRRDGVRSLAMRQGLFAWDGAFYRDIAEHGYHRIAYEAIRFFPLYPLVGRILGAGVGSTSLWLVVVANACALAAAALLHRLCLVEGLGRPVARRAATLLAILPASFVLVWAYAEAPFLVLAIATLLAVRRGHWWLGAAAGLLAGVARPTGALLALGVLAEGLRGWRTTGGRGLLARAAAVAAPVVGVGLYLWWVQAAFGDWRRPLRVQDDLRGGVTNPITRVFQAAGDLVRLDVHGLHLPFVIAVIVLAVVAARRLPAGYSTFAVAVAVVTIAAGNLNSTERYALDAFPLVVAVALLLDRPVVDRLVRAGSAAVMISLTALAWLQIYVP